MVQNCNSTLHACTNSSYDTEAGEAIAGLMPISHMVKTARARVTPDPYSQYVNPQYIEETGINTVAVLGIGAPPSGGWTQTDKTYTWAELLCQQSPQVLSLPSTVKHRVLNIGGWGLQPPKGSDCFDQTFVQQLKDENKIDCLSCTGCTAGTGRCCSSTKRNTGGAIRWQKSDVMVSETQLKAIIKFLDDNGYTGISFDIEGVSADDDWTSGNEDSAGWHLTDLTGRIQAKGKMAWIVIPAYNVDIHNGGPIVIANWTAVTLVQLMAYGNGLDSLWAGNPDVTQIPDINLLAQQVMNLRDSGARSDQIMLSFSYNMGGYSANALADLKQQEDNYVEVLEAIRLNATAGTMAWCKGNSRMWSWGDDTYGNCAIPPTPMPTTPPTPPTPPPAQSGTYTVKAGDTCYNIADALCHDGNDYTTEICKSASLCGPGGTMQAGNEIHYDCSKTKAHCPTPPLTPPPTPKPAPTPPIPTCSDCYCGTTWGLAKCKNSCPSGTDKDCLVGGDKCWRSVTKCTSAR